MMVTSFFQSLRTGINLKCNKMKNKKSLSVFIIFTLFFSLSSCSSRWLGSLISGQISGSVESEGTNELDPRTANFEPNFEYGSEGWHSGVETFKNTNSEE
jgi:hypothetical protein